MDEKKPVMTAEFWRNRILKAISTGKELHTTVYETDPSTWRKIGYKTYKLLDKHLRAGDRFLDAGCGYGAVYDFMDRWTNIKYTGVDISPDLIEMAKTRYPSGNFLVADLRQLPFEDQSFDLAFCRSVRGMIIDNLGEETWHQMETELLRVAKQLLTAEYGDTSGHPILSSKAKGSLVHSLKP
jgi:SAM-dependent methyltransferase